VLPSLRAIPQPSPVPACNAKGCPAAAANDEASGRKRASAASLAGEVTAWMWQRGCGPMLEVRVGSLGSELAALSCLELLGEADWDPSPPVA